ncbi:MAG: 6-pyruvoyl-tetrahydropterin synthase-related protein [Clostridia bacterium]|jgi:6-pyruvoyl tetrahydropterin synthase-like protein
MLNKEYRFRFFLNARHTVNLNKEDIQIHPHTWEIVLTVRNYQGDYFNYRKIESEIKHQLITYENKLLNNIPPFNRIVPIMENIAETLNRDLISRLFKVGGTLVKFEISENPRRTYILNNAISEFEFQKEDEISAYNIVNSTKSSIDEEMITEKSKGVLSNNSMKLNEEKTNALKRIIATSEMIAITALAVDEPDSLISAAEGVTSSAKKLLNDKTTEQNVVDILNEMIKNDDALYSNIKPIERLSEKNSNNETLNLPRNPDPDEMSPHIYKMPEEDEKESNPYIYKSVEEVKEEKKEEKPTEENKRKISNGFFIIVSVLFMIVLSVPLILWISRNGQYPWGSEIWGHLAKVNEMYKGFMNGNSASLLSEVWNNGISSIKFWAPIPHLIMFLFRWITGGNVVAAYNLFIVFMFVFGAFGWILWGAKTGRRALAIALAILWFALPDNLRVLFSEGDIGRLFAAALIPYIILVLTNYLDKKSIKSFILLVLLIAAISVSHVILALMLVIAIFVYSLVYGISHKKATEAITAVAASIIGMLLAFIWYYSAYNSGLLYQDMSMFADMMRGIVSYAADSINPMLRLDSPNVFYFGLPVILISIFGLFYGDKKSKPGFLIALVIFFSTTTVFLPFMAKLPTEQMYFMMRFTPVAMAAFFAGLMLWKNLKKAIMILIVFIIVLDCAISFNNLANNKDTYPVTQDMYQNNISDIINK